MQARVSALAESIERYSGIYDGSEARLRATFQELGREAIHPNLCMGYSERQYRSRERFNRREHKAWWVPEAFEEHTTIDWSPLWSLSSGRRYFLPTSFCYFAYDSPDPRFARADSNGCAAGSVIEEAILQGFLELVERDAVALWWYNRLRRPGLELATCGDVYARRLQRHYEKLHRDLWVLDITSDIGIPVFAAVSRRNDKPEEDIIYGFGCHLDPAVALVRALTELNQSLEAVPLAAGSKREQSYLGCDDAVHWWQTARAEELPYLVPCQNSVSNACATKEAGHLCSGDLGRDIRTCVTLAGRRGLDILVLDQTRPDVRFPVVRVVVPGLRHFWARFGQGRLYDIPVQQGWLKEPVSETQMNSFVIQF